MNDGGLSDRNHARSNRKHFYRFTLLTLTFVLPLAQAQEAMVLEEITVTAEKREADLQTVGISISAFSDNGAGARRCS